jgi:hypothetical protein
MDVTFNITACRKSGEAGMIPEKASGFIEKILYFCPDRSRNKAIQHIPMLHPCGAYVKNCSRQFFPLLQKSHP